MVDYPTDEELGEKLQKGEITREEVIEIMSERARQQAFATLFNPSAPLGQATKNGQQPDADDAGAGARPWYRRRGLWLVLALCLALVFLAILLG
ncbi:MAG: hypothetical protein GX945_15130 [Lentisphaerae bacterium]|jgi:hypothetical protein|nr:hypothetical protein [Lentisphaerota bacterium]